MITVNHNRVENKIPDLVRTCFRARPLKIAACPCRNAKDHSKDSAVGRRVADVHESCVLQISACPGGETKDHEYDYADEVQHPKSQTDHRQEIHPRLQVIRDTKK